MRRQSRQTLLFAITGLVVGLILIAAGFREAELGHGAYRLFGIASLPLLWAMMHTNDWIFLVSIALMAVQWCALGYFAGKSVVQKNARWAWGGLGVGMAYVAVFLVDLPLSRAPVSARWPGLIMGVALIVGFAALSWRADTPGQTHHR